MARTSSPPLRSARTDGPLNAFSIGICWSSTIPRSSALGSFASSASASGLRVRYRLVAVTESAWHIHASCTRRDLRREHGPGLYSRQVSEPRRSAGRNAPMTDLLLVDRLGADFRAAGYTATGVPEVLGT